MSYRLPHPEAKPPKLNPENVPARFHKFIPLAEKYGISDDGYRWDLMESLNRAELEECASFLEGYGAVLDEWLARPENTIPPFSDEYITFSALGMAADHAESKLRRG